METRYNENVIEIPASFPATLDERLARVVSDVLCPPVTVSIGMLAILQAVDNPLAWVWVATAIALTIGIPVAYIVWKVNTGEISDFHIPIRRQRFRPMLLFIGCILIAWSVLTLTHAPELLLSLLGFGVILSVVLLLITLRWKISGHSAAIAGMVTLIIHLMGWLFLPSLFLVPLVAWARIRIKRHTLAQTIAGAALGIVYINLVFW